MDKRSAAVRVGAAVEVGKRLGGEPAAELERPQQPQSIDERSGKGLAVGRRRKLGRLSTEGKGWVADQQRGSERPSRMGKGQAVGLLRELEQPRRERAPARTWQERWRRQGRRRRRQRLG